LLCGGLWDLEGRRGHLKRDPGMLGKSGTGEPPADVPGKDTGSGKRATLRGKKEGAILG